MKTKNRMRVWISVLMLINAVFISKSFAITGEQILLHQLVDGHYIGDLILKYTVPGSLFQPFPQFLDGRFCLTTMDMAQIWRTKLGNYNSSVGYWIFKSNINQCWQAVGGSKPLALWNSDGAAKGNPENFELFVFEFANDDKSEVYIRNINGRYVHRLPFRGFGTIPAFGCDADRENAASFKPYFIGVEIIVN